MLKLMRKTYLVLNVLRKVNSYKLPRCFSTYNNDDSDGDNKNTKSNKPRGVRLPGVEDQKNLWNTLSYEFYEDLDNMVPREVDVLIIGGGIIGWSVAYFLRHNAMMDIAIVERDPSHTRCATTLGIGAIRQQFSEPENIQMSLFGAEFLRNVREHLSILDLDPPDIQFHPHGFLTLASTKGYKELEKCYEVQKQLGAKVEMLSKHEIKTLWPWMEVDDLGGGIHGYENEGWFDTWQLFNALQRKTSSLGVQRVVGEVIGFDFLQSEVGKAMINSGPVALKPRHALVRLISGDVQPINFAFCVNAGGPWANDIGRLLGMGEKDHDGGLFQIPVEPRVQHSFVVSPNKSGPPGSVPSIDCPFIVDFDGLNVRRDRLGGDFIVFIDTPPLSKHVQKMVKVDDNVAGECGLTVDFEFFESVVRQHLSKRIPSLGAAKVRSGWSSYLDYNYIDQNLIIGFHPAYRNIIFTNGSSGHGIEHSFAIGRAVFELIIYNEFKTIDLKNFGFHRFYERMPVFEKEIY